MILIWFLSLFSWQSWWSNQHPVMHHHLEPVENRQHNGGSITITVATTQKAPVFYNDS